MQLCAEHRITCWSFRRRSYRLLVIAWRRSWIGAENRPNKARLSTGPRRRGDDGEYSEHTLFWAYKARQIVLKETGKRRRKRDILCLTNWNLGFPSSLRCLQNRLAIEKILKVAAKPRRGGENYPTRQGEATGEDNTEEHPLEKSGRVSFHPLFMGSCPQMIAWDDRGEQDLEQ